MNCILMNICENIVYQKYYLQHMNIFAPRYKFDKYFDGISCDLLGKMATVLSPLSFSIRRKILTCY